MGNSDSTLGHLEVDRDKSEVYEDWTMAPGDLEGVPVTVFSAAHPPSSRKRPYIERALQASRVYRHPGLLKYLDGALIGGEVVVVMERATPLLHHHLDTLSPLHIAAGLLSITETLTFLHDRAGVSHNNVSAASIFLTPDGTWKLWGLEYSCSFGELTRDHVEHINSYCHDRSVPPDDKSQISPAYQHARDSYAFAHLVQHVLTSDTLAELDGAETFLSEVRESGLSEDWSQRPRLSSLAQHSFFTHDFLTIYHTLTNILLLTHSKREEFLKCVGDRLRQYPEEVVSSTLAGALLSRPLLLHPAAASHLMPILLTPRNGENGGLFSNEVFQRDIVPQVVRLFGEHDATVRCLLLTHLPHYVNLIPRNTLSQEVLPEVLLGIRDSSEGLVAESLRALATLVPLLGADTVIGSNRHALFTTAMPKAVGCLPLGKASVAFTSSKERVSSAAKTKKSPVSSKFAEPPPPPPPPRSISLPPGESSEVRSDATSLDSLSLDGLATTTQIPERSSPDGGEDSTDPTGTLTTLLPPPQGSDGEPWSSDWEEMMDTPHTDFSSVLLSLNLHSAPPSQEDGEWSVDKVFEEEESSVCNGTSRETDYVEKARQLSSSSTSWSVKDESPPVKSSSSMKLKGIVGARKDSSDSQPKRIQSLGEEFDVLAIKINKKRDPELDLFADLTPSFNTKKFDLETMLLEADHKSQGAPHLKSVSETLAGLDTTGGDDAWGYESGWGDTIEVSQVSSASNSPIKLPHRNLEAFSKDFEINSYSSRNSTAPATTITAKEDWDDGWGDDF